MAKPTCYVGVPLPNKLIHANNVDYYISVHMRNLLLHNDVEGVLYE